MTKYIRKVFQVTPELRARRSAFYASVAAPFDTPTSVVITSRDNGLLCEFTYDLGQNEPTSAPEKVGPAIVTFGQVSGRIMRLEIPQSEIDRGLTGTAEELKVRRSRMSNEEGTPLRKAAHYDLVGAELLPGLTAFVADQLPELRRQTR